MQSLIHALSGNKARDASPGDMPPDITVGPHPEAVSHDSNTSQPVPTNILTFRTITSMLSFIQQNDNFEIKGKKYNSLELNDPRRRHIKICSAFASVAVMDAEVVAVVANPTGQGLEVIVCNQSLEHAPSHMEQEPPRNALENTGAWSTFFSLFAVTKNPERDDPQPPKKVVFKNVQELCPDFTGENSNLSDAAIIDHIEQSWAKPSLAKHLYLLPRLITMKENPRPEMDHVTRIFCYIAGTCHLKMSRRFRNKTVSIPYLANLNEIKEFDFRSDIDIQQTKEGTANESSFLKTFVGPIGGRLNIPIPRIMEQAKLAENDQPFKLYTKDTYKEFHSLFMNILNAFQASLQRLKETRGSDGAPISADFRKAQLAAALNGYALLKLSESTALRKHLKNIQPLLAAKVKKRKQDSAPGGGDEADDDEFRAVAPFTSKEGVTMELYISYLDWIRLLVVHFDAIEIILTFVNGQYFPGGLPFLIKLLDIPPIVDDTAYVVTETTRISSHLLPWHDLFHESGIFPKNTGNNAEVYDFLSETVGTAAVIARLNKLWKVRSSAYTKKRLIASDDKRPESVKNIIKDIIQNFDDDKLKIDKLPSKVQRKENVTNLLDTAKHIQKDAKWKDIKLGSKSILCTKISNLLDDLQDELPLFVYLAAPTFKGTLHCEACLASLMLQEVQDPEMKTIWKEMQDFQPNFGVSKYCCPVCAELLHLLNPNTIVKGSHNTVTPCSLPTWLPAEIVDSMNQYFGELLKEELVRIMMDPDAGRGRTKSTGSHRLSEDSADGAGTFSPTFTAAQIDEVVNIGRIIIT